MKVAFVTSKDPLDKRSWSGIYYYMLRAFEKEGLEVKILGPYNSRWRRFFKYYNKIARRITGRIVNENHNIFISKECSSYFNKKLSQESFDFVFAPTAGPEIAFLETRYPIIYSADATFSLMNNYYDGFSHYSERTIKMSNEIEQRAIDKATYVILPSKWAATSVEFDYHKKSESVFIFPYGANLDNDPYIDNLESKMIGLSSPNLLFLGVDWQRKGGEIAYQAFLRLKDLGLNPKLTICGCTPPNHLVDPQIVVIPFLNKNLDTDYKRFIDLMNETHFLLLPTRKEAYGIVFCEASAYGIPSITYNTGGVAGAVVDGLNGLCLSMECTADDFAIRIKSFCDNPEMYRSISLSSRDIYTKSHNWSAFAKKVISLINK